MKEEGYKLIAIEQAEKAVSLDEFFIDQTPIAVVFGHEVNGVDQSVINVCDMCIEIPQIGTKHSLNISVSVGIVLWDLWNKLIK